MLSTCLKIATVCLSLPAAARSLVLIQAREADASRTLTWTLSENGLLTHLGRADAFKVPPGRNLVITEAAWTVRGGLIRACHAAQFRISMRMGRDTLTLAERSGRIAAYAAATTVAHTFTPGLVAPSGAEVLAAMTGLVPGGGDAQVEITLYGFFLTSSPGS